MRKWLPLPCLLWILLATPAWALRLRDGDLLFVTAANTGLSAAINDATAAAEGPGYDHVALLAHDHATTVVLHADEQGSREQSLSDFLADTEARKRQVVVYRLRAAGSDTVADAIAQARRMLGKPYNHLYVLNEASYYCSDFIERAFRAHRVFALQPMRFRNPDNGQIAPYWIDFYRQHGMAVPEGQPGSNPNDLAASPALRRIGRLR